MVLGILFRCSSAKKSVKEPKQLPTRLPTHHSPWSGCGVTNKLVYLFSMHTFLTHFGFELDAVRGLTCCPTFLLGFSGCYLVISAAVLTDKCIVERLATMW